MTGQQRFRLACVGSLLTLVACLPLDDLSGYSGASVAPFAGGSASGGSSSGGTSSGAAAEADSGQSGEGLGGALSLDPSGMAGSAGESDPAPGAGGSAAPVESADAGSCDGADEFADAEAQSCYRLTAEAATWLDARAACIGWGGDLVRIESAVEDDFLTARLTSDVWIGVNDRATEGSMVWADGSPLAYANWGGAQPDDFNAQEDCGEKRVAEGGAWNDSPCDGTPRAFLCER